MKKIKRIVIIALLLIIYAYVCYIQFLPSQYIIIEGENLNISTILGISLVANVNAGVETVQAVSNINKTKVEKLGKTDFTLNLFNLFKVKDVTVNVIPKTTVVPVGAAIGMKLYTDRSTSCRNVRNRRQKAI